LQITVRSLLLWVAIVAVWLAACVQVDGFRLIEVVVRGAQLVLAMLIPTALLHHLIRRFHNAWAISALGVGLFVFAVMWYVGFLFRSE